MTGLVEHRDAELHDVDAAAKTRHVLRRPGGYRRDNQESDASAHVVRMIYVPENCLQPRRAKSGWPRGSRFRPQSQS
jgi:hypothetical protein